jgi:uncharacterized protein (UPF0179 family)
MFMTDKFASFNQKPIITLIGVGQALVGKKFIYNGLNSKCENCKYVQVCVKNLELKRVYEIVKVRKKAFPCELFETEMQVVEVVEAETYVVLPTKHAIESAIITLQKPDCDEKCDNYEFCFPVSLIEGDSCEIISVIEKIRCFKGWHMRKASVRRVFAS